MNLQNRHIIYLLVSMLGFFSCAEDNLTDEEQEVEFCVNLAWDNGRGGGTRTLSSLLGASGSELEVSAEDYPSEIHVTCNSKDFTLTRTSPLEPCTDHAGFYHGYTSEYPLKDIEAKKGVTATATIDGEDVLYSEREDVELAGLHLKFTMHHSKALLRFAFKTHENYDKIRYIKVTNIAMKKKGASSAMTIQVKTDGLVLTKDQFGCAGYCYFDPTGLDVYTDYELTCTYDIYDKDSSTDEGHITRKGVKATNTFRLSQVFFNGTAVSTFAAGKYYDLNITINPDYLYVLSDHDNKQHLTIQ